MSKNAPQVYASVRTKAVAMQLCQVLEQEKQFLVRLINNGCTML